MLERSPRSGRLCADMGADFATVRRVLMLKVHHYIFYVYDADAARVDVVAVWSNFRGGPPPLPR